MRPSSERRRDRHPSAADALASEMQGRSELSLSQLLLAGALACGLVLAVSQPLSVLPPLTTAATAAELSVDLDENEREDVRP